MVARLRTIETLEDVGTVSGPGIDEAQARYWLRIQQEVHQFGNEQTPGLYRLTGSIEPLDIAPFLLMNEENLTLTLRDGRKLGFFVKRASVGEGRCEISLTDTMTLLEGLEDHN